MRFKYLLLALSLLIQCSTPAQEWAWTKLVSTNSGYGGIFTLALDSHGNSYLNAGSLDRYLAKFSPTADLIWMREGFGLDLVLDRNANAFLTDRFSGSVVFGDTNTAGRSIMLHSPAEASFLVKLDRDGNALWARKTEGYLARSDALATDGVGNVYLTGTFQKSAVFSSESPNGTNDSKSITLITDNLEDTFLAKYSASGDLLWAQKGGGRSLVVDNVGDLVMTGSFWDSLTLGTEGVILTNLSGGDMFVAKFTSEGSLLWAKQLEGEYPMSDRVAVDSSDNIYANLKVGNIGIDEYLVKFSPNGQLIRKTFIMRLSGVVGCRSAVSAEGEVYEIGQLDRALSLGGFSLAPRGPMPDFFIAKFNSAGEVVWAKQAGGINPDNGLDIALGPDADIWVSGSFFTATTIGDVSLNGIGCNLFLSRMSSGLPSVISQPQNVRSSPGKTATFCATVTNASNPRFQWRKDGIDVIDNERINGATTTCLCISNLGTNDLGRYSLAIQSDNGSVATSPAELWFGPLTQFISKTMLTNGSFQLDFVGEPGRFYNIEASTNAEFKNFNYITNFFCNEGVIRVFDWEASNFPHRFYRAVSTNGTAQ